MDNWVIPIFQLVFCYHALKHKPVAKANSEEQNKEPMFNSSKELEDGVPIKKTQESIKSNTEFLKRLLEIKNMMKKLKRQC